MKVIKIAHKHLEKDPVCGMDVDPEDAAGSYEYEGKTYFFCNPSCLKKFQSDPAKYLNGASVTPHEESEHQAGTGGSIYICPMDPEVREFRPGSCPKCGMALEPLSPTVPATRTEYTCPMHPEIVRDEPGFCPICGMALEPRTVTVEEKNEELIDMTRRFKICAVLTIPLLFLAMSDLIPGQPVQNAVPSNLLKYIQLILATPVVLWGGLAFLQARLGIYHQPQS